MSTITDLQDGIRNLCIQSLLEYFPTKTAQNKGVIFSHMSGAEPSTPFVAINVLDIRQVGGKVQSSKMRLDETISFQVPYEIMVQFSFSGSTAGDMAQEFTQNINNNVLVIDQYKGRKIGVMRKSNIRRIPQLRDTKWVEYYTQDVTFSYILVTKQAVDVIESVIVEDQQRSDIFTVPEGVPIP